MPYKRRRASGGRLSKPVYYYAKLLDKKYRQGEAEARLGVVSAYTGNTLIPMYNPATGKYDNQTLSSVTTGLAARGKGSYGIGRLGRSVGGMVGGRLGNRAAGAAVGGFIGRNASNYFLGGGGYSAAGSGEYGLTNSLVSGSSVAVPTMMGGDEIGSIVVSHKEYLGNITGSMAFENSPFNINPGLSTSFPWLSQIACNYEEYSFEQLMFTYTSLLSDSTSSGVIGSIIMTTNYNAAQEPFTNTADMLNNIGTISARPIDGPIIHGVECDDAKNVLPSYFVRNGAVPPGQDVKTYDQGRFQIATEGMPVDSQLQGQLWVSYCVVLRKPKIWVAAGKGILTDAFKGTSNSMNENYPMGTSILRCPANNIGIVVTRTAYMSFRVNFPLQLVQGSFLIRWGWMNPTRSSPPVFPVAPNMIPTFSLSNCVLNLQSYASQTPADNDASGFGNNGVFQSTDYSDFDPQIHQYTIVRLLGSYAVPTYINIAYPNMTGVFAAEEFWLVVSQVNPLITADQPDNPTGWIASVVSNS
jgi:hypothetical protein